MSELKRTNIVIKENYDKIVKETYKVNIENEEVKDEVIKKTGKITVMLNKYHYLYLQEDKETMYVDIMLYDTGCEYFGKYKFATDTSSENIKKEMQIIAKQVRAKNYKFCFMCDDDEKDIEFDEEVDYEDVNMKNRTELVIYSSDGTIGASRNERQILYNFYLRSNDMPATIQMVMRGEIDKQYEQLEKYKKAYEENKKRKELHTVNEDGESTISSLSLVSSRNISPSAKSSGSFVEITDEDYEDYESEWIKKLTASSSAHANTDN
jgi:hypothetical protein